MSDPRKEVVIDYTNWRGERERRRIQPVSIEFANTEWHPETQWLLEAVDLGKGASRSFAIAQIHSWVSAAQDQNAETVVAAGPDVLVWRDRSEAPPKGVKIWVTDGVDDLWLLTGDGKPFPASASKCKFWTPAHFPPLPDGRPATKVSD